jgi:hypothetical protein
MVARKHESNHCVKKYWDISYLDSMSLFSSYFLFFAFHISCGSSKLLGNQVMLVETMDSKSVKNMFGLVCLVRQKMVDWIAKNSLFKKF